MLRFNNTEKNGVLPWLLPVSFLHILFSPFECWIDMSCITAKRISIYALSIFNSFLRTHRAIINLCFDIRKIRNEILDYIRTFVFLYQKEKYNNALQTIGIVFYLRITFYQHYISKVDLIHHHEKYFFLI